VAAAATAAAAAAATVAVEATVAAAATVATAAAATATPMGTGGAERWGPRGQSYPVLSTVTRVILCHDLPVFGVCFVFVVAHLCF